MLAIAYAAGFVRFASRDSTASRDLRHFWPALLAWPIIAPIGWINSALNRM